MLDEAAGVPRDPGTITVAGIVASRVTRHDLALVMAHDTERARAGALARPRFITSLNGNVIANYHRNADFRDMLHHADLIDIDGMPLVLATKLLCRHPLHERVATTDFIFDACEVAAEKGIRFFFLGAKAGIAATAAENLQAIYPGLEIVGTHHGYFDPADAPALCDRIVAAKTDVLWLGLGSPRQEQFVIDYRDRLAGVAWLRTCGGLFDHYSGSVSRAPMLMQDTGLEWFYRALREPWRLGLRYLATNPVALYHLLTKTHD